MWNAVEVMVSAASGTKMEPLGTVQCNPMQYSIVHNTGVCIAQYNALWNGTVRYVP